jgi:hypothetical protein
MAHSIDTGNGSRSSRTHTRTHSYCSSQRRKSDSSPTPSRWGRLPHARLLQLADGDDGPSLLCQPDILLTRQNLSVRAAGEMEKEGAAHTDDAHSPGVAAAAATTVAAIAAVPQPPLPSSAAQQQQQQQQQLPVLLKSCPGQSLAAPTYELALFRYVGKRWRKKAAAAQQLAHAAKGAGGARTDDEHSTAEDTGDNSSGSSSNGSNGASAWLSARRGLPGAFDPQHICPNGQ